jgi:hypothetical protein
VANAIRSFHRFLPKMRHFRYSIPWVRRVAIKSGMTVLATG